MTPQVARHRTSLASSAFPHTVGRRGLARYSVGGFTPGGSQAAYDTSVLVPSGHAEGLPNGPRRVKLVEAWRVGDLVVPTKDDYEVPVKDEDKLEERDDQAMDEGGDEGADEGADRERMSVPFSAQKEKLSEEERRVRLIFIVAISLLTTKCRIVYRTYTLFLFHSGYSRAPPFRSTHPRRFFWWPWTGAWIAAIVAVPPLACEIQSRIFSCQTYSEGQCVTRTSDPLKQACSWDSGRPGWDTG